MTVDFSGRDKFANGRAKNKSEKSNDLKNDLRNLFYQKMKKKNSQQRARKKFYLRQFKTGRDNFEETLKVFVLGNSQLDFLL